MDLETPLLAIDLSAPRAGSIAGVLLSRHAYHRAGPDDLLLDCSIPAVTEVY